MATLIALRIERGNKVMYREREKKQSHVRIKRENKVMYKKREKKQCDWKYFLNGFDRTPHCQNRISISFELAFSKHL
jgi:hypothetical protein